MKNFINKLEDSFVSVVEFCGKNLIWFLLTAVLLDVALIGAYLAWNWENYFVINSVFVVNFAAIFAVLLPAASWLVCCVDDIIQARKLAKHKK
jgi:hypothetical protein